MVATYRKKPVEISAIQFTGEIESAETIIAWMAPTVGRYDENLRTLVIPTLEGDMAAQPGDFIIRGIKNEFYPCRVDIFAATYDFVFDPDAVGNFASGQTVTQDQ